jgi:dTDP-4-dehydrorhamnose reductase
LDLYQSVVITGGGGMLAQDLKKALEARGVRPFMARHANCDITDRHQVSRLFQAHRPSLVFNCAAHTGVDQCEDEPERANAINGTGPAYLAELSREYRSKLVHFSTDFIFDGHIDQPYRPKDTPNPLSAYGKSKLLGEQFIQNVPQLSWLTVRTAWLYGRYGNCFPKIIVDRARAGHTLKVVDDQVGCPTYAPDLAKAVLDLLDHDANGIWHLTNSSPTSWYQFAKAIMSEFQIGTEVTPISTAQWVAIRPKQARRPRYSVLDITPYTALSGQEMRNWRDALRDYRTEVEKGS